MSVAPTNRSIIGYALRGENAETGNGNMSTDHYREGFPRYSAPYVGQLPKVWASHLSDRFRADKVRQVIYSYSTPIAWLDEDYGWIMPHVRYSVTTSAKHQVHLGLISSLRRVPLPWDATDEDLQRVLDRKMYFGGDGRGGVTRPFPGPAYVAGE